MTRPRAGPLRRDTPVPTWFNGCYTRGSRVMVGQQSGAATSGERPAGGGVRHVHKQDQVVTGVYSP